MVPSKQRKQRDRRMFLRILFRSLMVRKTRVFIAYGSILIGAAVVFALLSLSLDISIKMSRELRAYGANFFIGVAEGNQQTSMDAAVVPHIMELIPPERVVGVTPYLYGIARLNAGDAVVVGVDFAGLRKISPFWQVQGTWIAVDFDDRHCMVGHSLARAQGLKPGDQVTLSNRETGTRRTMKVRGVVETGGPEDNQLFVTIPLAQKLLGAPDRVNHLMMSILPSGFDVESLAARIQQEMPGTIAEPLRRISWSEGKILQKIKGLMAMVAAIILIASTLCVMTTLMAMVVESSGEIALLKALGAENRDVVRQFLSETGCISLAGILSMAVGFVLAQLLGQAIFSAAITFRLVVAPLTLFISMTAALAAAAVPVRMAVRIAPAIILKGK